METEEIWKDVPGYEGYYQVSNIGRVRSLDRLIDLGKQVNFTKGIVLKPYIDTHGYYQLSLHKNGLHKHFQIHLLIAMAFLAHIPCGHKLVVNHINGNRLKNVLNNLEIVTHRENVTTCFRRNRGKTSSKFIGVSWSKEESKWSAIIQLNKKQTFLGRFSSEIDASNAYQAALKEFLNQ